MRQLIYVVDTNLVSDLFSKDASVINKMSQHTTDILYLCQVVDFEIRRGFLHRQANAKLKLYETLVRPKFQWLELDDSDWVLAAEFWADTRRQGKQLADIDLLLAAITVRLNAILVSSDADFDALPVTRENWR
jgi:predicted nucleic acid-binding protein